MKQQCENEGSIVGNKQCPNESTHRVQLRHNGEDYETFLCTTCFVGFREEMLEAGLAPTNEAVAFTCGLFAAWNAFADGLRTSGTRLCVHDDDEDRVRTWDAMVDALDDALDTLPSFPRARCTGYADTIGGGSQVRCGGVEGHAGPHRHRRPGEWEPSP